MIDGLSIAPEACFRFMAALGSGNHALVDQFVICSPNGWGTAVVGVNEGTAGGILMPPAGAFPLSCIDGPRVSRLGKSLSSLKVHRNDGCPILADKLYTSMLCR